MKYAYDFLQECKGFSAVQVWDKVECENLYLDVVLDIRDTLMELHGRCVRSGHKFMFGMPVAEIFRIAGTL